MLGARMHYAVPRLLHEAGLLDRFYTDSYIGNKPWLRSALKTIPAPLRPKSVKRWLGRAEPALPPDKVRSFESLGIWYAWARRMAQDRVSVDQIWVTMATRFAAKICASGFGSANVVWGFNTASLELFIAARAQGRCCVLEQTILPRLLEDKLMREEEERWPGWQPRFRPSEGESNIAKRQRTEWELADRIVVGSKFVQEGLIECGVPPEKVQIIPYGIDLSRFPPTERRSQVQPAPLRVIYVGEVGLRKGALYLLEALTQLGPARAHARFAGQVTLDRRRLERYAKVAEFLGPVPRSEMPALYQWAQVFALPSIVEGSATASYEALLSGLPIIVTPNTGAFIDDGVEGRIVPIRDVEALASALAAYADDPSLLRAHSYAATLSRERLGLKRYGQDIEALIFNLLAAADPCEVNSGSGSLR